MGFPGGPDVRNPPANVETQRHGFDPWVRKIPWCRKWQPTPILLPGDPIDRGVWWATLQKVRHD